MHKVLLGLFTVICSTYFKGLDQNGDLIQILVLQNYLFFGNANSVLNYVNTMFEEPEFECNYPLPPIPRYLIMDMTLVTGVDQSVSDIFNEIGQICKRESCILYICGLGHHLKTKLVPNDAKPSRQRIRFLPDLETALARAENGLLKSVLRVEEQEMKRTHRRRLSIDEDGFEYSLRQIDQQV
jgi:SulP family sulfate permease